jgi:hypothetical protein
VLTAEKLEWGNYDHISNIIKKHPDGFDIVLGADIYILLNYFTMILSSYDNVLHPPYYTPLMSYINCIISWTLTHRKLPAI